MTPGGPGAGLGRPDAVRRRSGQRRRRLAPAAPAAGARPDDAAFDPAATWTLFAGGDILLDRGVYKTVRIKGKGVDFPFDGGTARDHRALQLLAASAGSCRGPERTGERGRRPRTLITGADIAIANFENPAPNRFRWHTSGTVFSADPALIDGLVNAGIDYVSLANNHIGDAGDHGILQTIANLEKRGLEYSGAGKDLAAARKPAILEANGTTVAILAYDAIAQGYYARPGRDRQRAAARCGGSKTDIKAAREAGADVVIVFPHWGAEYRYEAVRSASSSSPATSSMPAPT